MRETSSTTACAVSAIVSQSMNWASDDPGPLPTSRNPWEEMKGRGFKFVGPTIVYAWMQAVGIVNDHSIKCYRRAQVSDL